MVLKEKVFKVYLAIEVKPCSKKRLWMVDSENCVKHSHRLGNGFILYAFERQKHYRQSLSIRQVLNHKSSEFYGQ